MHCLLEDPFTRFFLATINLHYIWSYNDIEFYLVSINVLVWSMKTRKLDQDLPGHADEVFAVDWAPDGERVASGGKDKVLRL